MSNKEKVIEILNRYSEFSMLNETGVDEFQFGQIAEEIDKLYTDEKIIFHGGCVPCDSQSKFGKNRCTGCMFFEANWNLPDLSTYHEEQKSKMDRIRKEFLNAEDVKEPIKDTK